VLTGYLQRNGGAVTRSTRLVRFESDGDGPDPVITASVDIGSQRSARPLVREDRE
jgi:hypothetical protein